MSELAERLDVPESHLYGVATFYSLLSTGRAKHTIRVCNSISCHLGKSDEIIGEAQSLLGILPGETTTDGVFRLETAGCLGACGVGPAVLVDDRLYTRVDASGIGRIIVALREETPTEFSPDQPSVRSIGEEFLTSASVPGLALDAVDPGAILAEVEASGLCGRGGAAFPTARKWRLCAESAGDTKYVVCNADESEPGTFKDRWLLTQCPGLVVLGMALAGLAIGAREGYIYLRGEYPDVLEVIEAEVERLHCSSFDIKIVTGAGAYVCGEETALLESIEGRRGVPRLRPPYPPVSGLFGCPTVINNVETLANIPLIVARGSEWFRSVGTAKSTGTKLFCVSGDVERPGIVESPMGVSLSEILAEAGAGELKAALVGGASGRLVAPGDFDRKLCYEDLPPGSGAIVAIGRDRSIRGVAANLMEFFSDESCGECSICRIGTARMAELLSGLRAVEGSRQEALRSVCGALADGARCGLGQAASVALLDALRLFDEEFA